MIMDEVMTGFGRTGKNFAIEHWNVIPDIIAFAKGVSSGYVPLGGIIAKDKFYKTIQENSGVFFGGYTFGGNPLSSAVGVAVLNYIIDNDLISKAEKMGKYLSNKLEILLKHPTVGDIRGKGLMLGIEFVKNKKTKETFAPEKKYSQKIGDKAYFKGVLLYPGTGCVDGVSGDHILIGPPFIINKEEIDEVVQILDETITEVEKELKLTTNCM
jgi:adenosylmethionine-8-amino-7-oxononanoate aminotransferase